MKYEEILALKEKLNEMAAAGDKEAAAQSAMLEEKLGAWRGSATPEMWAMVDEAAQSVTEWIAANR